MEGALWAPACKKTGLPQRCCFLGCFSAGKPAPGWTLDSEVAVGSVSSAAGELGSPFLPPPPSAGGDARLRGCPPAPLFTPSISLHTNTWAVGIAVYHPPAPGATPLAIVSPTGRRERLGDAWQVLGMEEGPPPGPQEPSVQRVMEQHCPQAMGPHSSEATPPGDKRI